MDLDAGEITWDMQAVAVPQRSATNAHDQRPCSTMISRSSPRST